MGPNIFDVFIRFIHRRCPWMILSTLRFIHLCSQHRALPTPFAHRCFRSILNRFNSPPRIQEDRPFSPRHPLISLAQQHRAEVMIPLIQSCQAPPLVLERILELLVFNAYHFKFQATANLDQQTANLDQQIEARAHCVQAVLKAGASIKRCPQIRMARLMFHLESSQERNNPDIHPLYSNACFKTAYRVFKILIHSGLNPMNMLHDHQQELSAINRAISLVCSHHKAHPSDDLSTVLNSPAGQILLLFLKQGNVLLNTENIDKVERRYPDLFHWLQTWYVMHLSLTNQHHAIPIRLSESKSWSAVHSNPTYQEQLNAIITATAQNPINACELMKSDFTFSIHLTPCQAQSDLPQLMHYSTPCTLLDPIPTHILVIHDPDNSLPITAVPIIKMPEYEAFLQSSIHQQLNSNLICAAETGNVAAVKVLIVAGADVNAVHEQNGHTALMCAKKNGHTRVVEALITAGVLYYPSDTTEPEPEPEPEPERVLTPYQDSITQSNTFKITFESLYQKIRTFRTRDPAYTQSVSALNEIPLSIWSHIFDALDFRSKSRFIRALCIQKIQIPLTSQEPWLDLNSAMSTALFGFDVECDMPPQPDASHLEDDSTALEAAP